MVRTLRKSLVAVMAAVLVTVGAAGFAQAVDAPNWVAALHVEAQKMIGLRWMPVGSATGYKVLRSTTAGSGYEEIASVSTPQHFDKDLEPGTTYFYVLQAVAGSEVSANSAEKSVTIPGVTKVEKTLAPEWDKLVLDERTEFGKTTYQAGIFWKAVPGVVAYNVYRSQTKGGGYELAGSVSETKHIDPNVELGKTYYYVLSALDGSFQETPYSEEKVLEVKKSKKEAKEKKIVIVKRPTKKLYSIKNYVQVPGGQVPIGGCYDVVVNEGEGIVYLGSGMGGVIVAADLETGEVLFMFRRTGLVTEAFKLGPDDFKGLLGLGIDDDGNVYAADISRAEITVFSGEGNLLRHVAVSADLWKGKSQDLHPNNKPAKAAGPIDVALDPDGNMYVSDGYNNKILVFDDSGKFQFAFGLSGDNEAPEGLGGPSFMHFSKGALMIVNQLMVKVSAFDSEGEFLWSFGKKGTNAGELFGPTGIFGKADGSFIVLSGLTPQAQMFDGTPFYQYALADEKAEGPIEVGSMRGVWVDSKERVYIASGGGNEVAAFQMLALPPPSE